MAERRYSLRFSLPEGFLFVVSLLVASSLIFLFGVYVGKAGEMSKLTQPAPIIRVPVALAKEQVAPARPRGEPPVLASVPAEPPEQIMPVFDAPPEEEEAEKPAATPRPAKEARKEKPSSTARKTALPPPKDVITTARDKRNSSPPTTVAAVKGKSEPTAGRWSVQVQETDSRTAAQDTLRVLRAQGHSPVMTKVLRGGEVRYRIRVGNFSSQQEAVGAVVNFRRGQFSKAYMVSE